MLYICGLYSSECAVHVLRVSYHFVRSNQTRLQKAPEKFSCACISPKQEKCNCQFSYLRHLDS